MATSTYHLSLLEKMRLSLFFKAAQSYQKGARGFVVAVERIE